MRDYEYMSPSFLKEESPEDIMSIRFSADGLSFCVRNAAGAVRAFGREKFDNPGKDDCFWIVRRMLAEDPYLSLPYRFLSVQAEKREKLLIPGELFDLKTLPVWMSTVQDVSDDDRFIAGELACADALLVSSFPSHFTDFMESMFKNYALGNSALSFIKNSVGGADAAGGIFHAFIDLHGRYFDILLTCGNKIVFFNAFDSDAPADVLYYTLRVFKASGFPPDTDVAVSGCFSEKEKLMELLVKYMPHVRSASCREWMLFCPEHPGYASENVHLINDGLCVL